MSVCCHVFFSDINSTQSRLYKEASFVLSKGIVDDVYVLGLWNLDLPISETDASGLKIIRKPTLIRRLKSHRLIKRFHVLKKFLAVLSLLQYCFFCIFTICKLRPDHVSCHNAAMLPVAWAASKLSGATLEYIPHELETQRSGLTGMAKWLTTLVERLFIRAARNIVVVCDPIRDWYQETYGLTNVYVVRNVPEKAATQICHIPEGGFRERFNIPDSATIFMYQGLFSAGRGIEILLDTFAGLNPACCHLVFMGYGEEQFQALIDDATRQHSHIHFQPAVSREWIVSYSTCADVGIFISERASLSYKYSLPNKFFEWAHAGLPILVSDNLKYQASLLNDGGFGWAVGISDLAAAIERISQTDLASYAQNARRFAASAVWEEDAKVFEKIYRAQIASRSEQDE